MKRKNATDAAANSLIPVLIGVTPILRIL